MDKEHGRYHEYSRTENQRSAIVMKDDKGFYVILCKNGLRVETRLCYDHSEAWAERVAENYVDGILNI